MRTGLISVLILNLIEELVCQSDKKWPVEGSHLKAERLTFVHEHKSTFGLTLKSQFPKDCPPDVCLGSLIIIEEA